ncbi:MAG TPA: phage tail sheath subtilisin-like domain-containing protein, partial [Acidobacteriaceae bacterium]
SGSGATAVEAYDQVTYLSQSQNPAALNPAQYALTAVNSRSQYIAITADITARPANSAVKVTSPPTYPAQYLATLLTCGADGPAVSSAHYLGEPAATNKLAGTGLYALDKITDVEIIAIPGQGDPATVNAGVDYCKNTRPLQDCVFVGDLGSFGLVNAARVPGAQPTPNTIQDAVTFATTGFNGTPLDKSAGDFGAVYYPWVWSADPIGTGRNPMILLPPSGFVSGIYARIDNSRGVFKAPAGTEAGVAGALSLATTVSDTEQDSLNPVSVNVLRTVPGSGFVVWGARTFASDASWRYVPVRRMAVFLRTSLYYGIQWAVFEPNDEPLWAELRLNIRAFMLTQFRAGAFQGSTPDDAFFVACDSTTTTQQDIDNGVVNILVGFAPLKPAEFVVLKLSQKVNQTAS